LSADGVMEGALILGGKDLAIFWLKEPEIA
jgi:hypothetical protein